MDRGAWQATVHGVAIELDTTERLTLSLFTLTFISPEKRLIKQIKQVDEQVCAGVEGGILFFARKCILVIFRRQTIT